MDIRFVLLLACFFLSGFAALLYQTAWTRELSFVFGTSELAIAAVLAAYMGGLALGASVAARYADRVRRPVLVYGLLELGIALSALAVPAGIAAIRGVYVALMGGGDELPSGSASAAELFQLVASFAVLLPPTAFMGATLPLLARHAVRTDEQIGSRVGLLYAINTTGAIAGTLVAAFWLMPEFGLRKTVYFGAAINAAVFGLAALLARAAVDTASPTEATTPIGRVGFRAGVWILPAMAVSGAISFAYEVLWTRLLSQVLGASIHAFATMLASFLLGIALGSAVAARLATDRERSVWGFGVAQLGIALTSFAVFAFADRLPALSKAVGAGHAAPLESAAIAAMTLLPITLCIGATFPFAVRIVATRAEQAAAATARVFAWNTVGAIAGALGAGFLLLPGLGFDGTLTAGVLANLLLAAVAGFAHSPRARSLIVVSVLAAAAVIVVPAKVPWELLRTAPLSGRVAEGEILYAGVGRSATVTLFDQGAAFRLCSNGLPEAQIERPGMLPLATTARMLGILPTLVHPATRDMLVVGLGGAMALEGIPSSVETVDVIELEPEVLLANQQVASRRSIDPLSDPRVRVHIGDARGAMQITAKRYDAVVSQPSHPWTAGASHLYTEEFFRLVLERLRPSGIFVQWIGLNFVDEPLLRTLLATLNQVFENVQVFQPGAGSGLLFAASNEPFGLDDAQIALETSAADLARFGFHRVEDVAAMRVLDAEGSRALAQGASNNTDDFNQLASRASRLGDRKLDAVQAIALWKPHDPLRRDLPRLDHFALTRRLAATGFGERANNLALEAPESEEETLLGWIEVGKSRPRRAARHFARAIELAPGSSEAVAGLVASLRRDWIDGRPVAGVDPDALGPQPSSVIAGWRYADQSNWEALRELDDDLAQIRPGEPLFADATRLRIQWRISVGDAAQAARAVPLIETLLARNWQPLDALLRARVGIAAERPDLAMGTLDRLIGRAEKGKLPAAFVETVLKIAQQLPAEMEQDVRRRMRQPPRR